MWFSTTSCVKWEIYNPQLQGLVGERGKNYIKLGDGIINLILVKYYNKYFVNRRGKGRNNSSTSVIY